MPARRRPDRRCGSAASALGLSGFKPAEDGGALVLRTYEPAGARGAAELSLPDGWELAGEVNLLEEAGRAGEPLTSRRSSCTSWRFEAALIVAAQVRAQRRGWSTACSSSTGTPRMRLIRKCASASPAR